MERVHVSVLGCMKVENEKDLEDKARLEMGLVLASRSLLNSICSERGRRLKM